MHSPRGTLAGWRAGEGDGGDAGSEGLPTARPTQGAPKPGCALALSAGWAQPAPKIPGRGGCTAGLMLLLLSTPQSRAQGSGEILQDCINLALPGDATLGAIKQGAVVEQKCDLGWGLKLSDAAAQGGGGFPIQLVNKQRFQFPGLPVWY